MAKIIKSIFHTGERRKLSRFEEEEERNDVSPPLDGRRKLSISRSGRMRQANKKRHSLSLEVYGQKLQHEEKTKSTECNSKEKVAVDKRRHSTDITPEEEIDNAFQIIDKS